MIKKKYNQKTHEDFMKELYANNIGYRNGLFKVVGKFKGVKNKIILKDQYGYCAVLPGDLTRGTTEKMTIKSAIFKTEYLKEYLRQNNKYFYKNNYRVVSKYKKGNEYIFILDIFGNLHKMKPSSLFNGCSPSIKSAVDKKDYIFRKICKRNKYFKSGELKFLDFYISNQKTMLVVEDSFGLYNMDISVAYTGSRPTIEVAVNKDENLINRLKQNGGDYDYSKVVYTKMDNKVTIICKKHGEFKQKCHNHIRGEGCDRCGTESMVKINAENPTGWSYTNWINAGKRSKQFDSFKVYIVKVKARDSDEEFYKIGKTYNKIKRRFNSIKGYDLLEVIKVYESDDGREITNKEVELLRRNKQFRYKPKSIFGGYMECFSKVEYD